MSDTGKQSPLGVNVVNTLLTNQGLYINPKFVSWVGTSQTFSNFTFGRICGDTVLRLITWSIQQAYNGNPDGRMYKQTYDNLISIGAQVISIPITQIVSGQIISTDQFYFDVTYDSGPALTVGTYIRITGVTPNGFNGNWEISEVISNTKFRIYTTASYGTATVNGSFLIDTLVPALGNAKPLVYSWEEPNAPYGVGIPYLPGDIGWGGNKYQDMNPATQWGYNRLLALQAWMEFNYNNTLSTGTVDNPAGYRDFVQSFQSAASFVGYSNSAILSIDNSKDFLDGTFSNMNDLITADITNVNLALKSWGQDLIKLGKAIDLSNVEYFGLPSVLLRTLAKYNGINQNLSLAIIAAGISVDDLGNILSGVTQPTIVQERNLYAAFMLTVGDTLQDILTTINCKTQGITSLADLLNPKKLFPNSYASLTVPIYTDSNTTLTTTTTTVNGSTVVSNLTNSKVSYLLYSNGGVNSQLTSPDVVNKIGIQSPPNTPPVREDVTLNTTITIQAPAKGFGSYLATIVPSDIAVTAGAFAAAMQQIRNIKEVPIEKFAQVVNVLETMTITNNDGVQTQLNTNEGTANNVPVNLNLRTSARPLIALGSGPQGSYTGSDFFGCMSGIPYNGTSGNPSLSLPEWGLEGIYNKLTQLATQKLFNIYHELYLAVTWERARASISQSVYYINVQAYVPAVIDEDPDSPTYLEELVPAVPRIDDWYYTVSFGLTHTGGGYGRGTAPAPNVTITPNNCNASMELGVHRNDSEVPDKFGKVYTVGSNFGNPYLYATTTVLQSGPPSAPTRPEEFITVQGPPSGMLPVLLGGAISTDGTNTDPGYTIGSLGNNNPGYNAWHDIEVPIQGYINQANTEIQSIKSANNSACIKLNNYWNSTGYHLTIEQRARMTGLKPPLADPRENFLSLWPTAIYTFVDSIPSYSISSEPHMWAQTLENISNFNTVGGQSIVGMMRQERNQSRLALIGIELDNNIPDKLTPSEQKNLIVNGPLPIGTDSPNIPGPTFDIGDPEQPGSFAGSPYTNLIPPNLNSWYTSTTLNPGDYSVNAAIDEVIRCNCDCWNLA